MDIPVQAEKAERLRKLHHGPRILVFPNAWDVASARMMEEAGYPAIATSSASRGKKCLRLSRGLRALCVSP
jgi:2-methylisocitrate lyase-like PEP mutase family enzyme